MSETPRPEPSLDDRVASLEASVFHHEQVLHSTVQAVRNQLTSMTNKVSSLDDRLSNIEATNDRIEARLADFDKAIVAIKTNLARQSSSSYQK